MHRLALVLALAATAARPAVAETQHPEGVYTGAKPGVRPGADDGRPQRPPPSGTLSWIGFEAKDGAATVWLQAASAFDVTQRVEGGTLVVSVTGLHRMVRNTRRPIDTRYFESPIARISARVVGGRRGRRVEVRIAFKNPKDAREATARAATEADGLRYVYLAFPAATDETTAVPDDAREPG